MYGFNRISVRRRAIIYEYVFQFHCMDSLVLAEIVPAPSTGSFNSIVWIHVKHCREVEDILGSFNSIVWILSPPVEGGRYKNPVYVFQFHCMDSYPFRCLRGARGWSFQFHCMDSALEGSPLGGGKEGAFNSIVWIRPELASKC